MFGAGIKGFFCLMKGEPFKNLFSSIVASETLKNTIKSNNYARATMCRKETLQLCVLIYKREILFF